MMKKIGLDIKHFINRNLGNAIKNISCSLHYYSKKSLLGRCLYAMNNAVLRCASFVPFEIINHSFYAQMHPSSSVTPIVTDRIGYTGMLTYGLEPLEKDLIPVAMGDIYVAKHANVRIQGNSDFILNVKEKLIINDFCYNMSDRYVMFDGILLRMKDNVAVLRNKGGQKINRRLKSGIMISGKFSRNYYHEMYEILSKLLILDKICVPNNVPLVVDQIVWKVNTFKNIFEALNTSGREVILIGEKEVIEFDTLYYISAVNFISPHYKDISAPDHLLDFVFDRDLTLRLRDKLLVHKSDIKTPERIFITRKNTNKRNYNEAEVYKLLENYGFETVAPETYNFYDQMALFNNAQYIVGGSGAAFTNLLFCKDGCRVICFRAIRNYSPIFSTVANFVGVKMRYLTGVSCNEANMHADYIIATEELKKIIEHNED